MEGIRNHQTGRRERPGKIGSPRVKWQQPEGGYKEFRIGDLFIIETPKRKFNAIDVSFDGIYPYVVRTSDNNGIRGMITEDEIYLNPANTISFGQDTATIFYQKQPYFTGDKIKVLSYKDCSLTESIALYLLAVMRRAFSLFSWGSSSFNVNILNDVKICLPVRLDNSIDYDYIELRIRELEESRIRKLEAHLIAVGFEDCELSQPERDCLQQLRQHMIALKSFKIAEIFNDFTGRDIIIRDAKEGNVPLISHQHDNNGISKYIAPIEGRRIFSYKDTLSLADRGVFLATTQNQDFHIGTRVKALTFKEGEKSESVRLFFVTAINKLQIMFSEYLTNATDSLPGLSIMLPVNDNGVIDFEFMDNYVSAIKKQCIAALKQEITSEREAYELSVSPLSVENDADKEEVIFFHDYREGCVPLYTLRAACGYFEYGEVPENEGWVDVSNNGFTPDLKRHFAVHAKGDSMFPKIQNGDICVFEWYKAGSRNGEIVLTECSEKDLDYGGMYTIKKYQSEKQVTEEGWQHTKVKLVPLNKGYDVIELDGETDYRTIGVLKCVLSQ